MTDLQRRVLESIATNEKTSICKFNYCHSCLVNQYCGSIEKRKIRYLKARKLLGLPDTSQLELF